MRCLRLCLMLVSFAALVAACAPANAASPGEGPAMPPLAASGGVGAPCAVTRPPDPPFVPPAPYSATPPDPNGFWFGSAALWTLLPADGRWPDLPQNPGGYTQKLFWWREGYVWTGEPQPKLSVTARRLDGEPITLTTPPEATNGFNPDYGSFMLAGLDFPEPGCWEVTGHYHGQSLTYVVEIGQ